jgi:hypothetical protein
MIRKSTQQSRDSSTSVVTRLSAGLRENWVRLPVGEEAFLSHRVHTACEATQLPIQSVLGTIFPEVEQPGSEADHSPTSSVEVKNACSYTSTPLNVFMARCLIKHGENFTAREVRYRYEFRSVDVRLQLKLIMGSVGRVYYSYNATKLLIKLFYYPCCKNGYAYTAFTSIRRNYKTVFPLKFNST